MVGPTVKINLRFQILGRIADGASVFGNNVVKQPLVANRLRFVKRKDFHLILLMPITFILLANQLESFNFYSGRRTRYKKNKRNAFFPADAKFSLSCQPTLRI